MGKDVKRAIARWVEGMEFEAVTGSEHRLTMDGDKKSGASPMELLLVGMAGCTGIDVIDILKKKRESVSGLEVRVEGARSDAYPMVYTDIDVTYIVRGKGISSKAVEDAIHLSESKYCSASIMLGKSAKITSHYEITEE